VRSVWVRGVAGGVVLGVATMLVVVAAGWSPRVEYVLVAAVVAVLVASILRRLVEVVAPPVWPSPVPRRRDPAGVDPRVASIEASLRRGTEDAGVCRRRVQPLLLELAIHRLARHRGVGLVEDPPAARAVLGDDAFAFLSDVVEEPTSAATLARTVGAIERA
jgi:hypothetical protein